MPLATTVDARVLEGPHPLLGHLPRVWQLTEMTAAKEARLNAVGVSQSEPLLSRHHTTLAFPVESQSDNPLTFPTSIVSLVEDPPAKDGFTIHEVGLALDVPKQVRK